MNIKERMARAICWHETAPCGCECKGAENCMMWDELMPCAEAALKALREPTDGMIEAGTDGEYCLSCGYTGHAERGEEDPKAVWQAMIDAAMEGK